MTIALNELDLAWSLLNQRRFDEARRHAQSILHRFPDNVSALVCHAMALWKSGGDIDRALAEMRRATALAPDVGPVRHNLATLLASNGDAEESQVQFREALRIRPDDTLAFYGLTQNSRAGAEPALVDAMVALQQSGSLDATRREFLEFGLAKTFDDLGEPERAMGHALEANRLGQRAFDVARENAALAQLQELAGRDAFRGARDSGNPSRAPLFIVGMNRSGTTLVESILSRHPEVLAQGEMGQAHAVEQAAFQERGVAGRDLLRHQLTLELGRDWLSARAEMALKGVMARAQAPFSVWTDKLPENAVRLGLVARLFPKARVVHVRRHPLDTGISNFFQRFEVGQGYSNRLDWIGVRTRQVADSMAIWKRAVDLPILNVSYERLVASPEAESRRIIAFAGLEWHDDCLQPHRTQRSVMTASQWQVRQPIYRGSVGRWKRYEAWLGPMIEAMGGFDWIDAEMAASSGQGA